jgi:DNA-binding CsgD family transcriptional regulator
VDRDVDVLVADAASGYRVGRSTDLARRRARRLALVVTRGHVLSPLLVGRDDVLALAERRIAEARTGRGQLLLISGEAGIGKSRLISAIGNRAALSGFRTATAQLQPADRENPSASFLELARVMRRLSAFGELGTSLGALLDAARREGGGEPRRLLVDVAELVLQAVGDPTVLVFEDLQWADDLTLDLLGELARVSREVPLLLIGAYRSDEVARGSRLRTWRSQLVTRRIAEDVRLDRLTLDETAQMTTLILGTSLPAPRDVVAAVQARTDGVPLHIEELLAALGPKTIAAGSRVLDAALPETLEDATLVRVARLSQAAQGVARAGAVIGRWFGPAVLAGVMRTPIETLDEPLDELIEHDLLEGPGPMGVYGFRHQVLRDAIYGSVPPSTRRALHARAAELAAGPDGQSEIHASLHFERAGMSREAFATALAGASGAVRLSSHREASVLYGRAVRNLPPDVDPRRAADVYEAYGRELAAIDENAEAAVALDSARAFYLEAGDLLAASSVLATIANVRHLLGDGVRVLEPLLRTGLDQVETLEASRGRDVVKGRLLVTLAIAYGLALRIEEAEAMATEAIALARGTGDEATEIRCLALLANILPFDGRIREGIEVAEEALGRALRANLHEDAARTCRWIGAACSEVFEFETAERWLRRGIEISDGAELWNHLNYMTAHLGFVLWATGRWDEATDVARRAQADGRGGVTTRIAADYVEGYVLLCRGQFAEADARLGEALRLAEQMDEVLRLAFPIWGMAEAALLSGDPAATVALTERAWDTSAPVRDAAMLIPSIVTGTRARLAVGDPTAAADWIQRATDAVTGRGIPAGRVALEHANGLLLLASGSRSRALEALEAARSGWDAMNRAWEATWARLDLASCLQRLGRWAEAAALLREARAFGESHGSDPVIRRADELARQGRGRGVEAEPWRPLTIREFEVAQLVAAGLTNAELANELVISPRTAGAHVEHILAKLGVARRAEIGAWVGAVRASGDGTPSLGRAD